MLIATHNQHKLQEIAAILSPLPCIGASDFEVCAPDETGLTFIENALIKARRFSQLTQQPVIADDSGLVVPALKGQPGIYSARYAGDSASDAENRQLLLSNMQNISDRLAYFYCVMVYLDSPTCPTPLITIGQWHGHIIDKEIGQHGFGYDSIFYLDSHQCTAAELPSIEKNLLSHRGQALSQLKQQLIYHGYLS